MKKMKLIMIAVLLLSALMISCNSEVSESASGSDSLVKVTVMSSSKGMTVTANSTVNVESLYWFYTANKTDGSIFTTGQTGTTKTPVKTTVVNEVKVPTIGLVDSDLGLFSTGSWTFSFWGYKADDYDSTTKQPKENAKPVYYQENLAATVTGRTDLTLTLAEGEGMNAATVSFNNPTWTYTDLAEEVDLILRVYDGDPANGGTLIDLNGDSEGNDATATTVSHTATFTGIPTQTMAAGAHTLYFEVYYKNSNEVEEHVGETVLGLNLKKGTTYTVSGSIENLNETYHVFVTVVNKTTAVATQTAIASAQEVTIATPVTPQSAESSDAVVSTATDAQKTTVIFAEGGLDHTTENSVSDSVNGTTTTTTTSSTHELEVEVKTASVASTASYVVDEGSSAVAGINLTLTKTTTTTEVVTETNSSTQLSSTTNTESEILTTFNNTYSTIKTYVAKNLSGVQVRYNGNGEQPKFSGQSFATEAALEAYSNTDEKLSKTGYVPSTGLLVFKTNHFSEFYVTSVSVARIGNVYYGSLQAAIDAAKVGDTIVLLAHISSTNGYLIEKTLSLDTNGKTVTVTTGANINNRAFKVEGDGVEFSVYGGGIVDAIGAAASTSGTAGSGCYGAFRAEVGTTLKLENITLKNYRPWGLNVKILGAIATLDNVNIISVCGGGIEVTDDDGADGTVTGHAVLRNCVMTQSDYRDWCSVPVSVSGNSTVDVYSTSYTGEYGVYVFSSGGTINIYGGTFTANENENRPVLITSYEEGYDNNAVINVYGGTFYGAISKGNSSKEFINIYGGTFDHNPSAYVPRGYVVTHNETPTETWTVSKRTTGVAMIVGGDFDGSDLYFDSLQDAITAAQAGETIQLLADSNLTSYFTTTSTRFPISESLTIDGDNHICTVGGRGFGVGMNATSNIDVIFKNITINNSNNAARCIDTRGNLNSLTLDSVTLSTQGTTAGYTQPLTIGGNQTSPATIIIKNSTIQTNDNAKAYYAITVFNPVNMTIDGSTLKGWACLYFKAPDSSAGSGGSEVLVKNSHLYSYNCYSGESNAFSTIMFEETAGTTPVHVEIEDTDINITVTGDQEQSLACFSDGTNPGVVDLKNVTMTANGAGASLVTIVGNYCNPDPDKQSVVITGGSYAVNPSAYLADGYSASENNGIWTVSQIVGPGSGE